MSETHPKVRQAIEESKSFTRMPTQLIGRYARAAARRGRAERLEDGTWFASIPNFRGVWMSGDTREEAVLALESVVCDWTALKIEHKDRDLPVIDGIDLNVL